MKFLNFKVKDQDIQKDGDFSRIASGTSGYLYAKFSFSKEWIGAVKVAEFRKFLQDPVSVPVKNNICEIPAEVLDERRFFVRVVGKKGNMKIRTNECDVTQEG